MRTSIATVSLGGALREKLSAIARAGFDGFEMFENDLLASPMSPEEVAARSADLGLTIDLYQPMRDIEGVAPQQLEANLRRARAKFELMARLGCDTVLVCSNVATATDPSEDLAVSQLVALAELAADHGIKVAYEALAWGKYVSTYDVAWRLVESADHPALGVCLDSFHILSRGSDLATIAEIAADKIVYCQLADAPALSLDVLSWSRHHRVFPSEGDWDIPAFMFAVLEAGYTGPLSLEIFNDIARQADPVSTARDARRSLLLLEDDLATLGAPGSPRILPRAAPARQMGFVELDPGAGDAVGDQLAALGFTLKGTHRRKGAELWVQGDARIVVNRDREGTEPGIVAIGVEVDDVASARLRNEALLTPVVARDRAGDEEELAAVRAPDGIELYFGGPGSAWITEFEGSEAPHEGLGILGIDHVTLVEPWQRFDEAGLFFRATLGVTAQEQAELPSQSGLVRSRSLVSPGREVRLALNVAPMAAVDDFPAHVAFASGDVVTLAENLIENGGSLLPIPANYYDDLAARFDLDPDRLARWQRNSILYDRDASGEFLHVYLLPIGDVFFEVVQRIADYDGYGAADAHIRLAAQRLVGRRGRVPAPWVS